MFSFRPKGADLVTSPRRSGHPCPSRVCLALVRSPGRPGLRGSALGQGADVAYDTAREEQIQKAVSAPISFGVLRHLFRRSPTIRADLDRTVASSGIAMRERPSRAPPRRGIVTVPAP